MESLMGKYKVLGQTHDAQIAESIVSPIVYSQLEALVFDF